MNPVASTTNSKCRYCGKEKARLGTVVIKGRLLAAYKDCSCKGAVAEREASASKAAQENRATEMRNHLSKVAKAGIPPRYQNAVADTDEYVRKIRAGQSIVFSGPIGTSKTHLACAIALQLVDETTVKYTSITRINSEIFEGVSHAEIGRKLQKCKLLILDDLGKNKPSEWIVSLIFEVINFRYEQNLPVIVTTNYDMGELTKRLTVAGNDTTAKAIISRLYEMCQGKPVFLAGEDIRREIAEEARRQSDPHGKTPERKGRDGKMTPGRQQPRRTPYGINR